MEDKTHSRVNLEVEVPTEERVAYFDRIQTEFRCDSFVMTSRRLTISYPVLGQLKQIRMLESR